MQRMAGSPAPHTGLNINLFRHVSFGQVNLLVFDFTGTKGTFAYPPACLTFCLIIWTLDSCLDLFTCFGLPGYNPCLSIT